MNKEQLLVELEVLSAQLRELKNADGERKDIEEKYRALFENITQGIYYEQPDGTLIDCNPAALKIVGLSREQFLDRPSKDYLWQLYDETGNMIRYEELPSRKALRTGKAVYGVLACVWNPQVNDDVWMIIDAIPLFRTGEEKPYQVIVCLEDITACKKAEKEAKETLAFIENLFDLSPFSMWVCDLDGIVWRINQTLREALNVTDEQIVGKYNVLKDANLIKQGVMPAVKAVFEKHIPVRFNIPWLASDSGISDNAGIPDIYIFVSMFPILDSDGKLTNVICQWVDITERVRAEKALQERSIKLEEIVDESKAALSDAQKKLEQYQRLAEMGKLAGGISHKLRNPLASISNSVYFLKLELEDSNQDVQDSLDIIEKECQAATRIITDLLEFARSPTCHAQPIAIRPIVLDVLADQSMPQNISVEVDIAEEIPSILVDPQQMSIVLINFISNAYDAMLDGGKLTISAELDNQEGDWAWLSVADTGTGIKPEDMQNIFEPLFTTKHKGIGLGLPICQMLVEANGGEIKVDSQVGKGTVFSLKLPIVKE